MSSAVAANEPKPHRLFPRFDPEAAAVVTILLGIFQVLLSLPVYYMDVSQPKNLFLLPLAIGVLIVASGSVTFTCERSPSRNLLRGSAYSTLVSLLAALCGLCIYSVALNSEEAVLSDCVQPTSLWYDVSPCPEKVVKTTFRGMVGLLLMYDLLAVIVCSLLSASTITALKRL